MMAREIEQLRMQLDELRAQMVNLPVRHPPPETAPPASRVGVVVCKGPCGEDDFDDNRYWVKIQRITNEDTDASAPLTLGDAPRVKGNCETTSTETDRIVCVTNFGEASQETHFARPGAPVVVFAELDTGNPGMTRYYTPFIDLEDNGRRCDDSSSESSGTPKCLYTFRCTYYCETNTFGGVSLLSKTCGTAPANAGEWQIKSHTGDQCVLEFVQVGDDCPPTGAIFCPTPETFPDPPTVPPEGCCASSSASGGLVCIYTWDCLYDCANGTFGPVTYSGVNCDVTPDKVNEWYVGGTSDEVCALFYHVVGPSCPGPEMTGECPAPPAAPDGPTVPPEGCCDSSSSSGGSGSGSDGGSGSGSDGGSGSSSGACACPTKSITFISAINSIECNEQGGITLDYETETHTVYAPE